MSVNLGTAHGDIILDGSGVGRGVEQAASSLSRLEQIAERVGGTFAKFATGLAVSAAQGAAALAAGLGGLAGVAVKVAGDLQQAVANIASIKPQIDTSAVFSALNALSTRVPQTATQLADSLYNIFSSVEATQDQALRLVEQFAQGAVGAQVDAETFGTAILGIMNAYGVAIEDASHITDVFFNTVNRGVVSGGELATALGPVTAAAKAAGVEIDELGALIVGVTKEGGPAAQNINNLNNTLQKITTKDARKEIEALGVSTTDANGDFRSIIDILGDLKPRLEGMTEAQRANALQAIFPDAQARQGAATLLSQLDEVRASLIANQGESGSTARAFEKMVNTFNSQAALLRNTFTAVLRGVGSQILPVATSIVRSLAQGLARAQPAIEAFAGRFVETASGAFARFQAALPGLIADIRRFASILSNLSGAVVGRMDFDAVRRQIAIAFDGSPVAGFVDTVVRGMQLARDAALTVRQAAAGNWFGGQTAGINAFVRALGRVTQLTRDAILTIRQAFAGDWVDSSSVQGVVRALGNIATAAGNVYRAAERLADALRRAITPERVSILRQLWEDFLSLQGAINGIRVQALVAGLNGLAGAIDFLAPAIAALVGGLIDLIGRFQEGGAEADLLRAALILLGAWIATNKVADLVTGLSSIASSAKDASARVADLWRTLTRGPRLVVTVIRQVYQTVGKALDLAADAGRTITRAVSVGFASAQDAVIWAQLYGEQAIQTITRRIQTIYDALPAAPNLPALVQRIIPELDTTTLGQTTIPPIKADVEPQIKVGLNFGSLGQDLGIKLAGGVATAFGLAIGTAIAGSAAFAAIGSALLAAAPFILAALASVALIAGAIFVGRLLGTMAQEFVAAQGGVGPMLLNLFTQAIPFALGALVGVLANFGLQFVLLIIQGITQGIPALIAFVQSNFQSIVTAVLAYFFPLPTLIAGIVQQIGPTLQAFAGTVLATIGTAFSQIGTIVSGALSQVGTIVGETFSNLGTVVSTAISQVVAVLQGIGAQVLAAIQAAFAPVGAIIQAIISGDWGAAVQAGIQLLVNLFVVLPGQILGILGAGLAQVAGIFSAALSQAQATASAAFAAIVAVVTEAFAAILSAVTQAGAQIGQAFQTAFEAARATVSSILSAIGETISTALASFVAGFESTFNGDLIAQVESGMSSLRSSIEAGLSAAVAFFAALPGRIVSALGDLGGLLFGIGQSIVQGLINGIQSKISAVASAAQSVANAIPGPIAAILGIRSPSRVLAALGRDTGAGMERGLQESIPGVEDAARDLARTVAETVEATVSAMAGLGKIGPVSTVGLGNFAAGLAAILETIIAVAGRFAAEGLEAGEAFASAAGAMVALVVPAVEAFDALRTVAEPTGDQIGAFAAGVGNIARAIIAAGVGLSGEALDQAKTFAETAGAALGLILPAVEGFAALPRILQPTGDQLGVFLSGVSNLALVVAQASQLVTVDVATAAQGFAAFAADALGLILPAVEGFAKLRSVVQPTADQLGVFLSGITNVALVVIQASRLADADLLPHASAFAGFVGEAIGLILPAVEGFAALSRIVEPTADQLGVFGAGVGNVGLVIARASTLFTGETLPHASAFAEYVGKAIALILPAVEGFAKLRDIVEPTASQLGVFGAGVANVAIVIARASQAVAGEVLPHATAFADFAGKAVGLIGPAVAGFAKLADVTGPTADQIGVFAFGVTTIARAIADASLLFSGEVFPHATAFADYAAKAIGLLGSGVDGFAKLASEDFRLPDPARFDSFAGAVAQLARAVALAASSLGQEAAKAAGDFSEQAAKVVGLLGSGVAGLSDLATFVAPSDAAIRAFVATVLIVLRRVVEASKEIEAEAVKAAAEFSEGAGKAVALVGQAISALNIEQSIGKDGKPTRTSRLVTTAEIDALAGLIGYVTRKMIDLAAGFDPGALARMVTLADAAAAGIGALRGIAELIDVSGQEPKKGEKALTPVQIIDNLIALFTAGLGRLSALATIAAQYEQAATGIRNTMALAAAALSASLGSLPLGAGIGAQQLALATNNGQFLIRAEVVHRHEPIELRMLGPNGPWMVQTLQIDGKSRQEVAAIIADTLIGPDVG